jgi:hypothetical protein
VRRNAALLHLAVISYLLGAEAMDVVRRQVVEVSISVFNCLACVV